MVCWPAHIYRQKTASKSTTGAATINRLASKQTVDAHGQPARFRGI